MTLKTDLEIFVTPKSGQKSSLTPLVMEGKRQKEANAAQQGGGPLVFGFAVLLPSCERFFGFWSIFMRFFRFESSLWFAE